MLYQVFENVTRPVRADERERESCLWNIESEKSCLWNLKSRSSRGIFCFFFISSRGNFGTYKQRFLGTTSQFSWFLNFNDAWMIFFLGKKEKITHLARRILRRRQNQINSANPQVQTVVRLVKDETVEKTKIDRL